MTNKNALDATRAERLVTFLRTHQKLSEDAALVAVCCGVPPEIASSSRWEEVEPNRWKLSSEFL